MAANSASVSVRAVVGNGENALNPATNSKPRTDLQYRDSF
jgi:hypothetical protein